MKNQRYKEKNKPKVATFLYSFLVSERDKYRHEDDLDKIKIHLQLSRNRYRKDEPHLDATAKRTE